MGRLFGTDGVRGVANVDLTPELAMELGRAVAMVLTKGRKRTPIITIGKDTRISGDMLEAAITAGLCSVGADVISLGVMPTPGVAFLIDKYKADAGIVISASHNPFEFNGIKIFSGDGFKLPDELEDKIESIVLDKDEEHQFATGDKVGNLVKAEDSTMKYIDHLCASIPTSLEGMKIAVDCGNGAASKVAPLLYKKLKVSAEFLSIEPDGVNINDKCGSTNLNNLKKYVIENKLDAGIAYDGDADRCLCIDENGDEVNGDALMAMCALDLKERGKLRKNALVATVMSNMGLERFCKDNDIKYVTTKVGDRYVLEEIELCGYNFGGEQSGHIIFRDYATTGDGLLSSVQILSLLKRKGVPFSQLGKVMTQYPQIMINVKVSKEGKIEFHNNDIINKEAKKVRDILGDNGRLVLRVSGTEPLIRVMIEGENQNEINVLAQNLADLIKNEIG